jgi:hypothetical protein
MMGSYLLEINSHVDLEDLIEVNTLALTTLPKEEQTVSPQGSLTSHKGQLLVFIGNRTKYEAMTSLSTREKRPGQRKTMPMA